MQSACPLCVVHGPFGTGKSMLLVAAIHFFLGQSCRDGPLRGCRVAVAAHTNAAVDRVMCGLLQSGVTGVAPDLTEPEQPSLGCSGERRCEAQISLCPMHHEPTRVHIIATTISMTRAHPTESQSEDGCQHPVLRWTPAAYSMCCI